MKDVLLALFA